MKIGMLLTRRLVSRCILLFITPMLILSPGYLPAVRGLLFTSLGAACLTVISTIVLAIVKRRLIMDVLTIQTLLSGKFTYMLNWREFIFPDGNEIA